LRRPLKFISHPSWAGLGVWQDLPDLANPTNPLRNKWATPIAEPQSYIWEELRLFPKGIIHASSQEPPPGPSKPYARQQNKTQKEADVTIVDGTFQSKPRQDAVRD